MSMINTVNFVLKLTDLASGPVQRLARTAQDNFGRIDSSLARSTRNMGGLGNSINDLNKRLNELTRQRDVMVNTRDLIRANREIAELERHIARMRGEGVGSDSGLSGILGKGLMAGGAIATILTIKGILADSVSAAMEFGKISKSFETLTGNASIGRGLVAQLRELKQSTIMGASVYQNAQTLMGFGISHNEVVKDLKQIGDIAMGDVGKMASLTLAFSQVRAGGKLMGGDLLQFINAGFNPLNVMSDKWEQFGFKSKKSIGDLRSMMEKGAISAGMVSKAFEVATSKGGQFYGMMDSIGQTAGGKLLKLQGSWAALKIDLGNALMPLASEMMQAANSSLHWLNISKSAPDTIRGEKYEIINLVNSIVALNEKSLIRGRMLTDLKNKYPEWFSSLDIEKTKNQDLLGILDKVNMAYGKRIGYAESSLKAAVSTDKANDLYSLAGKVRKQAQYKKDFGIGTFDTDNFKYLGFVDRLSMDKSGYPYNESISGLTEWANWAEKEAGRLMGIANTALDKNKISDIRSLITEQVNPLLADPKARKSLWGKKEPHMYKWLQKEVGKYNEMRNKSGGFFSSDILNYDYSVMRNLVSGKMENKDKPLNSAIGDVGGSITGGGGRVVNIHFKNVVERMDIRGNTAAEQSVTMEQNLKEAIYRIFAGLPS